MFSIASQDRSSAAVSVRAAAAPVVDLENSAGLSQDLNFSQVIVRSVPGLSPAQIVALATREGSRPASRARHPRPVPRRTRAVVHDARARLPRPRSRRRLARRRRRDAPPLAPPPPARPPPAPGSSSSPGALVSRLVSRRARTIPRVPRSRRTPARFATTPSPPRARDSRTSRTRTSSAPRSPRCARWTSARTSAGSA